MKLSLSTSPQLSLQLSTGQALHAGIRQVHELSREYGENPKQKDFVKELQKLFFRAHNRSHFHKSFDASQSLKKQKVLFEKSLHLCIQRHLGEFRDSGFPYLAHVLSSAYLLARLGMPAYLVSAGMLHDAIEDSKQKTQWLNDLHKLHPALAYNIMVVSGPDIRDAVEKDKQLKRKLDKTSGEGKDVYPLALKCADTTANLYDLEGMKSKDGRSAKERQKRFLEQVRNNIIPYARKVDEANCIPIKNRLETFSLQEFLEDFMQEKAEDLDIAL